MQDFHELQVWRKGHQLTLTVYVVTRDFPSSELYGLTTQMRRAAASIGANIAEGCGRGAGLDFARFLQMAMGSASELEYHILLARDLRFIDPETAGTMMTSTTEVKRMLASLISKVRGTGAQETGKRPPRSQ